MKIAVITAIFGDMDDVKVIPSQTIPYDLFVFTENNSPIPMKYTSHRLNAKYFKCLPHTIEALKGYDAFLWIDGSIKIKVGNFLEQLVTKLEQSKSDIVIPANRYNDCIFDAGRRIMNHIHEPYFKVRLGNDPLIEQVEYYREQGHPAHWGLWCAGFFLRLNNKRMNKCYEEWWEEILKWTAKDQHSQAFVLRKHGVKIYTIPNTFEQDLVTLCEHKKLM